MSNTFLSMSSTTPGKKDEHDIAEHANESKKYNQGQSATDKVTFDPNKLKNLPPMRKPQKKDKKEDSSTHKPK